MLLQQGVMWEDLLRSITSLVLCLCVCLSFVQLLSNLLLQERPSLHKELLRLQVMVRGF